MPREEPAIIKTLDNKEVLGLIRYQASKPTAIRADDSALSGEIVENGAYYSPTNLILNTVDKKPQMLSPEHRTWVRLRPKHVSKRGYLKEESNLESMHPVSSFGWHTRFIENGDDFLYIINEILDAEDEWLTIVGESTNMIFESHPIRKHEAEILYLSSDWHKHPDIISDSSSRTSLLKELDLILKGSPPSTRDLSALIGDVSGLQEPSGETMRSVLERLLPKDFPEDITEGILRFLAFVLSRKQVRGDPVEFFQEIPTEGILRPLLLGHSLSVATQLDKILPYIGVFHKANMDEISLRTKVLDQTVKLRPWSVALNRLLEEWPSRFSDVATAITTLNEKGLVVSELPVTREEAIRNRELRNKRLAMLSWGVLIRGFVDVTRIGLKRIAYIGRSYTWPVRNTSWNLLLSKAYPPEKIQSPYPMRMHLWKVPPNASKAVVDELTNAVPIDWAGSTVNFDLFDATNSKWVNRAVRIIKSVKKRKTLDHLKSLRAQAPRVRRTSSHQVISAREAKVLDLLSTGIPLSIMESPRYKNELGLETAEIVKIATDLINKGVLKILYVSPLVRFVHVAFMMESYATDNVENMYSILHSLMKHCPTTLVFLAESQNRAMAVSRMHLEQYMDLYSRLGAEASEAGLAVNIWGVRGYQAYRNDLYQRLLHDDGTWDDDISAILSQKRS